MREEKERLLAEIEKIRTDNDGLRVELERAKEREGQGRVMGEVQGRGVAEERARLLGSLGRGESQDGNRGLGVSKGVAKVSTGGNKPATTVQSLLDKGEKKGGNKFCNVCGGMFRRADKNIKCQICDGICHIKCAGKCDDPNLYMCPRCSTF